MGRECDCVRSAIADAIEALLPEVSKPTRYTGGEWNQVVKDHSGIDVRVAWTFPDAYEVAMSHLGSQIMYSEINRRADACCERAFAPWPDMEAKLREHDVPLFTLETWTPVAEFDIMAFPLLYELTYTNIFTLLDLAGVPLYSRDRREHHPLVVAGGPCVFNAEPMADFLDVAVLGDGEQVIHLLLNTYREWKREGKQSRHDLLLRLAQIQGCYVPALYDVTYNPDGTLCQVRPTHPDVPWVVDRATVKDLDEVDFPTAPIVPNMDIIFDRAQVEVFRGCTRGCRFCHAGMVTRPVRERSPEKVRQIAEQMVKNTGYNELSLVSLSTADYTDIGNTVPYLSRELECTGVNVTLPSTRVDAFTVDLASSVQKVRRGSVTLAPEGGTERMRQVINKTVTDADIDGAFRAAFRSGYRAVKLYFIIGLPAETDADLAGIVEQGYKALRVAEEELGRGEARNVRVTVSVSVFVPKAHTPFMFEAQVRPEEIRRRQRYIRSLIRDRRIEYKYHESEVSHIEALLSLGDRRVGAALLKAWQLGARFDGWTEHFSYQRWLQAMAETGLDLDWYAHRARSYAENLPWDHLNSGVTREFLIKDHKRSLAEEEVGDCRWEACDECGACPTFGVDPLLKPALEAAVGANGLLKFED